MNDISEKFSLKWNNFQSNVSRTFSLLRNEDEFLDVTLVSEDQKMMSAHKLVLSACSPYFKHILTQNKHSHPLLCLDGVSSGELQSVLDYIYQGEVQVYPEQLDRFLEVGQKFQLEGLKSTKKEEEELPEYNDIASVKEHDIINDFRTEEFPKVKADVGTDNSKAYQGKSVTENNPNIAEIEEMLVGNIVKNTDGTYSCRMCGKNSGKNIGHMKNHVETHIEGLSFPCQSCGKTFRTRNAQRLHTSRHRRNH